MKGHWSQWRPTNAVKQLLLGWLHTRLCFVKTQRFCGSFLFRLLSQSINGYKRKRKYKGWNYIFVSCRIFFWLWLKKRQQKLQWCSSKKNKKKLYKNYKMKRYWLQFETIKKLFYTKEKKIIMQIECEILPQSSKVIFIKRFFKLKELFHLTSKVWRWVL